MALQLVKDFTVSASQYTNVITLQNPLTITQDGGIDDINAITPTYFYVYNDGKRRDPIFDPVDGTVMNLKYQNVILKPKSFQTVIITADSGSNGTSSRLYLQNTSVSTPTNMKIEIGSVLTLTQGSFTEDVLVMRVGGDSYGSFVEVIRNYRNSSSTSTALSIVPGNTVDVSTKHIYLSKTSDFSGIVGGAQLALNDVTTAIGTPTSNPNVSDYQTIYIKAVPQLQKTGTTQIPRIPTQHKTDVYFEISYRELPA